MKRIAPVADSPASFQPDQLAENIDEFVRTVLKLKPSGAKGTYVKSVTVSSTMGPGVAIDPNLYRRG